MKVVAILAGALIAAIGIVGVAMPPVLLDFARSLQTSAALYVIVAVRVAFGALLIFVAPVSRMPRTLRVIGTVIIVAALLALVFGVERAAVLLDWWSNQNTLLMRAWAMLAVIFGAFIIYAVATPRRVAAG